jgi:putative methanogenesis marker protein 12
LVFIGMDHGTTGISFSIISNEGKILDNFKIDREDSKAGKVSAIDEIYKRVDFTSVKLMGITYAMGDGLNEIQPLANVNNRGILSIKGAGKVTGGGTSVYSEIENSKIPSIIIPGLHKNSPSLDPLFKAAYSNQASSEKVSISYCAYLKTKWKNMIVADISSNSVNILVEGGKIKGAIDACLGAMGIVHGPLDLEMIRNIDEGKLTANEAFSSAGAVKIANIDTKVAYMKDELLKNFVEGEDTAKLAIDTLIMTVAMEIFGLVGIAKNKIEGIVLTGSLGSMKNPINFEKELNEYLKDKFPMKIISTESGSVGSALIARDVYNGKKNILGINVKDIES